MKLLLLPPLPRTKMKTVSEIYGNPKFVFNLPLVILWPYFPPSFAAIFILKMFFPLLFLIFSTRTFSISYFFTFATDTFFLHGLYLMECQIITLEKEDEKKKQRKIHLKATFPSLHLSHFIRAGILCLPSSSYLILFYFALHGT